MDSASDWASDDDQGCIPIVMSYMDDTNAIVHVEDAAFFVHRLKPLGLPLCAVLNKDKHRVMTSTNGQKLTDLLRKPTNLNLCSTSEELHHMISQNSTENGVLHEITDGI